jgi:hypothetical protein
MHPSEDLTLAEKMITRQRNAARMYGEPEMEEAQAGLYVPLTKRNDEERMVYGFAAVTDKGGQTYFDSQGDSMSISTVRRAWRSFTGAGGMNHQTVQKAGKEQVVQTGRVVEGLVIDDTVAAALMEELQKGRRGLFIGYHATDDSVWDQVKKGLLRGFSIGGRGKRRKVS